MESLEKILSFRVRAGRIARVDVFVHWTLGVLAALLLWELRAEPKLALLVVLGGVGSVLLHELAHCWGARAVGGEARAVVLWPLGGLAPLHTPMRVWPRFFATACGPLANLLVVLAALPLFVAVGGELNWFLPGMAYGGSGLGQGFLFQLVQLNVLLLVFNLVPAFPMDGGRLLHATLWPWLGFRTALRVAIVGALLCAGALIVIGLQQHQLLVALVGLLVVGEALKERFKLRFGLYDAELAEAAPRRHVAPDYLPEDLGAEVPAGFPGGGEASGGVELEAEPEPTRFERWREQRRQRREEEERQSKVELRVRLDEVLIRVSADGLAGLTREERRFLDYASAELRKEQQQSRSG